MKGILSGCTLTGPPLAVNGLRPKGDVLILEVEFNLPSLDMGTIKMEGCASECADWSIPLGTIGGGSIIPNDEIVLAGMNPLRDLELNINTGLATAGRGHFSASDSGVGIYGELEVNLGAYFEFALDLSDYWWVDDLLGENSWSYRAELDYGINIPFTILDHQVDGFSVDFDGSVCLKLFGNSASCGYLESEYQESFYADNSTDFTFTVGRDDYEAATKILNQVVADIDAREVSGDNKLAKLSLVGVGMRSHAGVASLMFRTLSEESINIQMISTSEIKISVVIAEKYLELAARALHAAFDLEEKPTED